MTKTFREYKIPTHLREWRNGRRTSLRGWREQSCASSNLASRTIKKHSPFTQTGFFMVDRSSGPIMTPLKILSAKLRFAPIFLATSFARGEDPAAFACSSGFVFSPQIHYTSEDPAALACSSGLVFSSPIYAFLLSFLANL